MQKCILRIQNEMENERRFLSIFLGLVSKPKYSPMQLEIFFEVPYTTVIQVIWDHESEATIEAVRFWRPTGPT